MEKQADQLAALETKFEELEEELKASRGDVDSNTAAVEKLQQVSGLQHRGCREAPAGQWTPTPRL